MTQHFHFSIGCLIVSKVQSESEMPSVIGDIIITAELQERGTKINKSGEKAALNPPRKLLWAGTEPTHTGASPQTLTGWALTEIECY